jgi:hypothetical protein
MPICVSNEFLEDLKSNGESALIKAAANELLNARSHMAKYKKEIGELKNEIKELEENVKMSEKTLTAAEKLAHAADMAHRSNAIYAAVKPSVSKSKSGPKLEPFSEMSPSRRPLPPQPGIFASMPTYAATAVKPSASKPAAKPSASKEKSKKTAESFSELPPSQRKTFGGKSKRRRLSNKKQTKRNR